MSGIGLRRHATSKIKSQADLFRIRTLVFVVKPLPSIASVSVLTPVDGGGWRSHGDKSSLRRGEVRLKVIHD